MLDIGRVCIKNSGREKGQVVVIIDIIDDKFVLVDGNARRKRCNIKHLDPLTKNISIEKNAPGEEVRGQLSALGYNVKENKIKKEPKTKESQKTEKDKKEPKKEPKKLKKELNNQNLSKGKNG